MIEVIDPNFKFSDDRGSLVQLVRCGYRQINVITSKAGIERGGHYHKLNREAFYVIEGSIDLFVNKGTREEKHHFSAGDMFVILPMSIHALSFKEDTILVSMYDKGVELETGGKDIYSA